MGYREEVNARIFIYMSFLKDVVKEIGNDYAGILADGSVGDIGGYVDTGSYIFNALVSGCLLYTSPSPRDATLSRMPSSA